MAQIWDDDKAMERLSEIKDGDHNLEQRFQDAEAALAPSWLVGEDVKVIHATGEKRARLIRVTAEPSPGTLGNPHGRPGSARGTQALVDWADGSGSCVVWLRDLLALRGGEWVTVIL